MLPHEWEAELSHELLKPKLPEVGEMMELRDRPGTFLIYFTIVSIVNLHNICTVSHDKFLNKTRVSTSLSYSSFSSLLMVQ